MSPRRRQEATCDKTQYRSRKAAKRAMRGLSDRLRAYLCPRCRYWHLTSNTERRR